jgi:hypothetical protein
VPAAFEAVFPPDDTGRLTFERFRYQAHLAFRFCLQAAVSQEVEAIVCEHFEDVAVQHADGWRLMQIKTRDAELGPWRLSDLLARRGALRALYRTHTALTELDGTGSCRLEARLEGAIARDDEARSLTPLGDGPTEAVLERCAERLQVTEEQVRAFVARVTVFDHEPPRDLIVAANLDLLSKAAPALTGQQLREIYKTVFERIQAAMEATLLADQFPAALLRPGNVGEAAAALVEAKRLSRELLVDLFGSLQATPALLRQITDPALLIATALERKLRLAGSPDDIVRDAQGLRAQAVIREVELASSSLSDPAPTLTDVRERLRLIGNSVAATVNADPPGPDVWAGVMSRLATERQAIDPAGIFHSDQMLLLGELCEVSDQCEFEWGVVSGA